MMLAATADLQRPCLTRLAAALEKSWDSRTAYLDAARPGNPAFGQCYPTARVVQWFFPETEIASGKVDTGSSIEAHFWNVEPTADGLAHIDLSWQQVPPGSTVTEFHLLDRTALGDSPPTVARCRLLLERVRMLLAQEHSR
jgi:hypothetical protein